MGSQTPGQTMMMPRMPDLGKQFQAILGQFMKMISDLLKTFTGMDLNAYLQLIPGSGQKIMQIQQVVVGFLSSLGNAG